MQERDSGGIVHEIYKQGLIWNDGGGAGADLGFLEGGAQHCQSIYVQ